MIRYFFTVQFDFGARIFTVQNGIAGFHYHFLVFGTIADGNYLTFEGFFFGRIRDNNTADCFPLPQELEVPILCLLTV